MKRMGRMNSVFSGFEVFQNEIEQIEAELAQTRAKMAEYLERLQR